MEIKVTFDHGKILFSPDPAYVRRGEIVSWTFNATALAMPLQWVLYLNHGSPFRGQDTEFITDTRPVRGQHTGRTRGMSADDPGEYKYGARIDDPINNLTLADDDPKLIVD